jgi:hypothetical protein
MEAERSTETLVSTFKITRRRNSEYRDWKSSAFNVTLGPLFAM